MTEDTLRHAIWNGWHSQDVRAIIQPTSIAEVVEAVHAARARGGRVKAIGGRHSFNNISFSGGTSPGRGDTILDLAGLNRVIWVDRARGLVRVQAGIALRDLVAVLAFHGLALPNIGAWMAQTLAGVLATGTHGSGGRHRQSLLSAFTDIQVVDGTATSRALTAEERGFLNLGCFGVVTEVTIACVPLYHCLRKKTLVDVDEAIDTISVHLQNHDHVDLRWAGRHTTGTLTTWDRNDQPSTFSDRLRSLVEGYLIGALHVMLAHYPYGLMPQPLTNLLFAGVGAAYTHLAFERPQNEIWYRALTYNSRAAIVPHDEYEFAVPMTHAAACVHAVREILRANANSAGFEFQLRFEGPSSVKLAPNYGIETMWFDFNLLDPYGTRTLAPKLAEVVLAHGGRPHWSKHIPAAGFAPRRVYGDTLDAWEQVRYNCDPDGIFKNHWYEQYLAPALQGTTEI